MKKLLLATSILAGTAGLAAAEITMSGDARMGVLNGFEFDDLASDDTGFTSRARVAFTLSGETDTGLSFGASFRADNSENAAGGTAGSVFLSGAFGKLSMGDVDGAALAAVGHVDGVGLTGLGDLNESVFIANGAGTADSDLTDFDLSTGTTLTADPTALYEYSANGFGIYVSATQPSYEFDDGPDTFEGDAYALGLNYAFDGYKVSFGYESLDVSNLTTPGTDEIGIDHWIIGGDATFSQFTIKARYGEASVDETAASADITQYSLSGTYAMDAVSVTAFLSNVDFNDDTGVNIIERDAYGIGASYDLGGGAKVVGGIVDQELTAGAGPSVSDTAFDLGVSFSF